ncbi:hypothetical protein SKAU_G00171840 [Synaphobranchus kaupii]|uniref:Uncharacterized protein n=1 Tax=Synaphobranchus kaupii TaxID=118154 RepID=A0A9Q1IYN4_SYNKA|nr:hypothetical protein SKAU_G00171840 [Synaphobranchus kaupii]
MFSWYMPACRRLLHRPSVRPSVRPPAERGEADFTSCHLPLVLGPGPTLQCQHSRKACRCKWRPGLESQGKHNHVHDEQDGHVHHVIHSFPPHVCPELGDDTARERALSHGFLYTPTVRAAPLFN